MTTEVASRSEFAQLVSYQVLCYIYRNKLIPVVHGDGLSDEIGRNHACTRPRLDDRLLASLVLSDDSRFQFGLDLWSFF